MVDRVLAPYEIIDASVDVLGTRVRDYDRVLGATIQLNDAFAQYPAGPAAAKTFFECPRQDSPGVILPRSEPNRHLRAWRRTEDVA